VAKVNSLTLNTSVWKASVLCWPTGIVPLNMWQRTLMGSQNIWPARPWTCSSNSYFMQSVRICLEGPSMYVFQLIRCYMMPRIKCAVLSNSTGTWVEFQEPIIQWKKTSISLFN